MNFGVDFITIFYIILFYFIFFFFLILFIDLFIFFSSSSSSFIYSHMYMSIYICVFTWAINILYGSFVFLSIGVKWWTQLRWNVPQKFPVQFASGEDKEWFTLRKSKMQCFFVVHCHLGTKTNRNLWKNTLTRECS